MGFQDVIDNFISNSPLSDTLHATTVTFQGGRPYANVSGLTSLAARVMSVGKGRIGESEDWAIALGATHVIQLQSYQPTVATNMKVKQGSATYFEIVSEGVRHPNNSFTVVACRATGATA